MNAPESIPWGWWSFDLPGYRETPEASTYSLFDYASLPPVTDPGNNFSWLTAEKVKPDSIASDSADSLAKFSDLIPSVAALLPASFRAFTRTRSLPQRIRSCTGCFLEAPDFLIKVAEPIGGWLVHFLSDQQWVLHWYLHIQPGAVASFARVLVSPEGLGFREAEEPSWDWENFTVQLDQIRAWYCAPTFSEFLYRFWLENEIWFALEEKRKLSKLQEAYLSEYVKGA